jgi:hypothetical protein
VCGELTGQQRQGDACSEIAQEFAGSDGADAGPARLRDGEESCVAHVSGDDAGAEEVDDEFERVGDAVM